MRKLVVLSILLSFLMLQVSYSNNRDENSKTKITSTNTSVHVNGKIIDKETGEPLIGALVKIEGTNQKVYTDFDGNFNLENIKADVYNISVSYISYEGSILKEIKVNNSDNTLKVELKRVN